MQLSFALYASRLKKPLSHVELRELLAVSQKNNGAEGISGFLHIEDVLVLQYLEGPQPSVVGALERIEKDTRHSEFTVLEQGQLKQRNFDGWKMALVESTAMSLLDLMDTDRAVLREVAAADPIDLISFLSANASFLSERPSVA